MLHFDKLNRYQERNIIAYVATESNSDHFCIVAVGFDGEESLNQAGVIVDIMDDDGVKHRLFLNAHALIWEAEQFLMKRCPEDLPHVDAYSIHRSLN